MAMTYGQSSNNHIDSFGQYIFLRQKRIYRAFGNAPGCVNQIYGRKQAWLYCHKVFDARLPQGMNN